MNNDFPHAVIEINNPENLILFHRVVIPSSFGDETQTPPMVGKYANVLMVYETNGHAYLYSSDGIPTPLGFSSGGILVVSEFPELEQAAQGFLYIKTDTGEAQITNDGESWTIIAGHYGAVYAVDAFPEPADAEPDSLYVDYATGVAKLTHDNQNWVTVNDNEHDVLLVETFPALDEAKTNVLYVSSTDQEARITGDNQHWVTISGGGGGGTSDFNQLTNRPKYAGQTMTSSTDIPDVTSLFNSLSSSLSAETLAREQGDNTLQQEFNAIAADLQDDVDALETQMTGKVDKVAGKGLSTNDFTNAYKNMLDNFDPSGEENVIEVVQRNGVALPITNKTVNVTVPTLVSQLTNDSNFVNNTTFTNALANKVDKETGKGLSTNDFTTAYKNLLDSAIQPADLNYTVMTDLSLPTNPSTTNVVLTADKVNIGTGATSDKEISLPVASTTQAGIINKATYDTIQDNASKIEAILGGTVAINNIPASPTQAQLTSAWQTAAGQTTLINGASILDTANNLKWTYYTNDTTWHSAPVGGSVGINNFTNTEAGIIKGSTTVGQVFAESNGTGSVNGWDALTARVTTAENTLANKVDKVTGKGLSTNDFTTALKDKLDGIEASADVNVIEKIQKNGTDLAITNKTVNITVPTNTSDLTNDSDFTTTTAMNTALANKVDKVTGKGLSTNDFTDTFKTKLEGIEAGAQVNSPLYSTTGTNTNGAMTQAATTNALAQKLSHGNLTTGIGLEKTVTGSGTNTAIKVEIDDTVVTYTDTVVPSTATAFVNTANIVDGAVTTVKIADSQITTAKIADDSITTDKILDNAVTSDKIDWPTMVDIVSNEECTAYKFISGFMVVMGNKSFNINNNAYLDITVPLPVAFLNEPHVVAGFSSGSVAYQFSNFSIGENGSTADTVKLRAFNSSGSARAPEYRFIAVGMWK